MLVIQQKANSKTEECLRNSNYLQIENYNNRLYSIITKICDITTKLRDIHSSDKEFEAVMQFCTEQKVKVIEARKAIHSHTELNFQSKEDLVNIKTLRKTLPNPKQTFSDVAKNVKRPRFNSSTMIVIIIQNCTFQYRFQLPQVKQNMISSIRNLVHGTLRLGKLENIGKSSSLGGDIAQCPDSPPEIKLCQQQSKSTQVQISNFSLPVQFYWITLICFKYLVQDCRSTELQEIIFRTEVLPFLQTDPKAIKIKSKSQISKSSNENFNLKVQSCMLRKH